MGAPDPARTQLGSVNHKPGAKPGAGGAGVVPLLHHNDTDNIPSAISHGSISTSSVTLPQPGHREIRQGLFPQI